MQAAFFSALQFPILPQTKLLHFQAKFLRKSHHKLLPHDKPAITNGEVSVLEKPEKRKPSAEDFGLKIKDNKIETVVVSNGKILENSLNLCEKEKGYVKNILQKKNIKQSNVFLMTLDALGNYNIIKKE